MIIGHEHKYLFIEVPHTASTAISAELRMHYGGEHILHKHANYTEFRRIAGPAEREYFVFASVRNPLDAAVTDFSKLATNHDNAYTDSKQFARNGGWVPDDHLERFKFIRDKNASFSDYFKQYFNSAYHNWFLLRHKDMGFVMQFERIREDFRKALALIGVEQVRSLPVVNKTSRARSFEDQYSPEIHESAVRVFGPFMKEWGYTFPQSWNVGAVSCPNAIKFRIKDDLVQFFARFMTLSSNSRWQSRINRLWK